MLTAIITPDAKDSDLLISLFLSLYSINNTAAPKSVEILAKKLTKNAKFMRSPINYMHFLQILV